MSLYELSASTPTGDDPEQWLRLIEDMVDSGHYDWAEDTLLDIGETIEESGRVWSGQIEAITNIQNAAYGQRKRGY